MGVVLTVKIYEGSWSGKLIDSIPGLIDSINEFRDVMSYFVDHSFYPGEALSKSEPTKAKAKREKQ